MTSLVSKSAAAVVISLVAASLAQPSARAQSKPVEQDPSRQAVAKAELARRGWKLSPAAFRDACTKGLSESPRIVALFIAAGVDVQATDARGRTALHGAGLAKTVALLLRANAKLDPKDKKGMTPLYLVAGSYRVDRLEVVKALVEAGADLSLTPAGGPTLLLRAELRHNVRVAAYLRGRGLSLGIGERIELFCERHVGVPIDQAAPYAVAALLGLLLIIALLLWRRSRSRRAREAEGSLGDGAVAGRPSLLELLYYCTARRGDAPESRSAARYTVSVVLLLGATFGVAGAWWLVAANLHGGSVILSGLLLFAWLLAVGVGAVGYGLGCPRCLGFFSRRTVIYSKAEGPLVEEKIPGSFAVRKEREVSWEGNYSCKRCGHGWSSAGRGVQKY